ncbi:hypothetical protein EPR50_G00155680 [Perca flavescens]|uniref:Ig-like domain-containing protein n=1 Tax=Perca flavescens TaxID=8167 RepID=A0A484CNG6_PERFV|nr:hypothetical protein EPR50_G00155680 [Perca flavescens]
MDSIPPNLPLLLLTCLLHYWQCARGQSSYTIDSVGLIIRPSSTVQSGTPVTLQCQVKVSHDNIPHLNHTFQLTRDDIPIHSSSTEEDTVIYELNPARAADSGSYECRVTVKDKSKASLSQNLDVTGLQTPILNLNNKEPYESEEFTATCSAPEEKGSLIFRFYQRLRNGDFEKIKQPVPNGNSLETTMVLRKIEDHYLVCDYEVNLVSGAKRSNRSNEMTVIVKGLSISPIMNVLPSTEVFEELFSKPQLTVNPIDIFMGDRFELTCSVLIYVPERISYKSIQFSIYKDNIKLNSEETYNTTAHPSKNGNYTCKAVASLTHTFVKESQTVVVKAKVPVSKPMLSVVGGTLVLGKSFQLLCHSDNGTLPITYTLFNSHMLTESRVVSKQGEQAIFDCSAIYKISDSNNFLCHAKNSENKPPMTGLGLLRSTIIEPVSKPVLTMLHGTGDVSEGQDLTLVCSVQRGTPPITFTWYHTETEGALATQTSMKLEGSYNISNVRREHRGDYYCLSTNQANETKQSHTFMIRVKMAGWKKGLIGITVFFILLILAISLILAFKRRLLSYKRKRTGELSVKSASTKVERLSLTQAEVNQAANVTPGMIGKSVWSEHASGSDSEDQNSVTAPENPPETQYTEVQTREADPNRALVKKGTNTVYSEVRNSKQGVPEQADGQGSVEYAQLNHDSDHHSDHGNHADHSVQDDYIDDIDDVHINTADQGECKHDPMPDC